jgi:hypothetical protein
VDNLQLMGEAGPQFHPGQSATLRLGPKNVLARFGVLHPATLKAFDIDGPVAWPRSISTRSPPRRGAAGFARVNYAPPALQAVKRDFAFLVSAAVRRAMCCARCVGRTRPASSPRVFDDFRGQGVPEGQKSGHRNHPATGRKELHRCRSEGDCRQGVGGGGQAGASCAHKGAGMTGDLVTITNGTLSAAINPLGAELWSLTDAAGAEYMTDADPAFWGGHAPLLFPIVGGLAGDTYRHEGPAITCRAMALPGAACLPCRWRMICRSSA